ncbi:MAG TPA: penicillin acylase family protein, partial [Terriglobales bacterium]
MTTSTISLSMARPRHRAWRVVFLILAALVLIVLGALGGIYFIARSSLPQLDGEVYVAGLSARVTVLRDGHGIPTLDAANLDDLFFAQGYVTAQDRLWQMDMTRRFAAGALAELLGGKYVEHDREQRILGLRQAARKAVEVMSAEDRRYFEAYARGVSAYIESHRERLPLEFRILRYGPRPWTVEDSTLIAAQMVKNLNHGSFEKALTREKILARLGPELTADLYVNSSSYDRPPTASRREMHPDKPRDPPAPVTEPSAVRHIADSGSLLGALDSPVAMGSNNWVVSGAHTVTGKPLLSNDMHLNHQMPNVWYEAHLRSGGFDVAGFTLPGMPYVIVGHNQRIAWGFTNIGPTVQDVYVERFNPDGKYLTPQGWQAAERRHEVIHVKGGRDVEFDVVVTRHGPIISKLAPGETRQLALRWTLYEGMRNPFLELNSAQNWGGFRQALTEFDAPGQNVVYADVDGNIGYQATGKIPIRAEGDGSLPANGDDDAHEWTGYIPFESLPSVFNPPSGIIATANGRIAPNHYPYSISNEWEAPWRTARIYQVLESGRKFSAADMLTLQTDIYSEYERYFAERFVWAVDHAKNPSARAKQAAEIMRPWDGRMTADSSTPTICYRARNELIRMLLEPKLGSDAEQLVAGQLNWTSYHWGMRSIWLQNVAERRPSRWLPAGYPNYDELLTGALEAEVNAKEM